VLRHLRQKLSQIGLEPWLIDSIFAQQALANLGEGSGLLAFRQALS
jgi:hypothetical protein